MPKIFITYRREDSSGYVGRLHERLSAAFGAKSVFMDLEDIKPGADFADTISKAVGSCDILIVLIGKQWLTINDATGRRRIDDPLDFVRLEIATALNRNVRVIPVLVRKASMPVSEELPEPLASMARRQAHELSDDRWDFDVGQLIKALGGGSVTHKIRRIWYRWRLKVAAVIGFMFFTFLLVFYFTSGAVDDAEKFLALVAKSDLHSAYVLTASAFQAQVSEESFADQVKRLGLLDNASATWTSREIKNNQATLSGSITTKQRGTIPLTMTLVKEGGNWRVLSLLGPQTGVRISSRGKEVPPDERLRQLIRSSLLDLNQAIQAKDFTLFHSKISMLWRQQITSKELEQTFRSLMDAKTEFGDIKEASAVFDEVPTIDNDGILIVSGYFPTKGMNLQFILRYIYEHPEWKLFGVRVSIGSFSGPGRSRTGR